MENGWKNWHKNANRCKICGKIIRRDGSMGCVEWNDATGRWVHKVYRGRLGKK